MENRIRPVWAEINLDYLAHNMQEIRKIAQSKYVMAVVKADAYGHGAADAARVLLENGADRLAVAVLDEALELRHNGFTCPIMILGYIPKDQVEEVVENDLQTTVISYDYAEALSKESQKRGKVSKVHIKVDTGMTRIGYVPKDSSIEEIEKISKLPNIELEGVFSHFANADDGNKDYANEQVSKFNWFLDKFQDKNIKVNLRHVGNSATIIDLPEYHFDMVRPGIILYGYYPSEEIMKEKISLKPVMTLKAKIVFIKEVEKGTSIGYGRKFTCERKSIIATLPLGYADGYTRMLSGKANVIVNGEVAPVVGNICMDQCMIDVTDIDDVQVGDEVILIGESGDNKLNADYLGNQLGTISYEIVCMVGKRVPRVYIEDGKVVKIRHFIH